jgi:hypothetical protein
MQPRRYEGKTKAENQLRVMLVQCKQREKTLICTVSPSLRGSVERMIAILKEEMKCLDEQIQGF